MLTRKKRPIKILTGITKAEVLKKKLNDEKIEMIKICEDIIQYPEEMEKIYIYEKIACNLKNIIKSKK